MRRFTCSVLIRVLGPFGLVVAACMLVLLSRNEVQHDIVYRNIVICWAVGMGVVGMVCLVQGSTAYTVDADGITRSGWMGAGRMLYKDIVSVEVNAQPNSVMTVRDITGRPLKIAQGLLIRSDQAALRGLLDPHLEHALETRRKEIGHSVRNYYPDRYRIGAGILLLAVVVAIGWYVYGVPTAPGQRPQIYAGLGFTAASFAMLTVTVVHMWTNTITVSTIAVRRRSAFRDADLMFRDVSSVITRSPAAPNGGFETTTIQGLGRTIKLNSNMVDYPLLREYILAHVSDASRIGNK